MTKKFHLGDLLSITDGRLLSPNHIGGVHKLLDHMTSDTLMTHQLPLAADAMQPELLQQHPWLKDFGPPEDAELADLMAWLDWAVKEKGEYHEVDSAPLAWGCHDPIRDLHNVAPHMEVIGVVAPEEVDGD